MKITSFVLPWTYFQQGNDKRSENMCDLPGCSTSPECVALCCISECESTEDADGCFTECVGAVVNILKNLIKWDNSKITTCITRHVPILCHIFLKPNS